MDLCQDIEGQKPHGLFKILQKKISLAFLALEYTGHGKSSGKFTNGNITKWSSEVRTINYKSSKKK